MRREFEFCILKVYLVEEFSSQSPQSWSDLLPMFGFVWL